MFKWLKENLTLSVLIAIIPFAVSAYSNLATKSDLQAAGKINSFKWAESNIKINELQLESLDRIKLVRDLTTGEQRRYTSIEKSTERIIKAQEALLDVTNIIN